uniref:Uncharacterized protein n=1 Tax=Cacopsylla melanoneura TaxID=428564 RepID=A0A8D8ZMA6_9HEMI
MFDQIKLSETNFFEKYKHVLGVIGHFSQTNEPRQKYGTVGETKNEVMSITSHGSDNVSIEEAGAASAVATVAPGPSNQHDEPLEATNTSLPVEESDEELDNEEVVAIAPDNKLFEFNNIRNNIQW